MAGTVRKRQWSTRKGKSKTAWVANYSDQHGKRHLKTFSTKRAADGWLTKTKLEIGDGAHRANGANTTVADAARLWLTRCAADGLERGSLEQYRTHWTLYIKPRLGDYRLAQLTPPDVEAWRDELLANAVAPACPADPVEPQKHPERCATPRAGCRQCRKRHPDYDQQAPAGIARNRPRYPEHDGSQC